MPNIKTLVQDIYSRVTSNEPFNKDDVNEFAKNLAAKLANRMSEERDRSKLSMSQLGVPCDRKLWYRFRDPVGAEPLSPATRIKFLFGDILEELLMFLARAAGHDVKGEQDAVSLNGIKGHRDGIIDGHLVDAKSASTNSFGKFRDHRLRDDDPFGYLAQLGSYLEASREDPEITDKNTASFLAIDKQHGHVVLDTYSFNGVDHAALVDAKRALIAGDIPERLPDEDGGYGNRVLGLECSYCEFKQKCFPGLRVFDYSGGPRFFTKVVKQPYNKNGPIKELKLNATV
jgi:hypothetical protein